MTSDDKVVPTNAGMLFFGSYPQEHIIQSDVACVLFRETIGASRYKVAHVVKTAKPADDSRCWRTSVDKKEGF